MIYNGFVTADGIKTLICARGWWPDQRIWWERTSKGYLAQHVPQSKSITNTISGQPQLCQASSRKSSRFSMFPGKLFLCCADLLVKKFFLKSIWTSQDTTGVLRTSLYHLQLWHTIWLPDLCDFPCSSCGQLLHGFLFSCLPDHTSPTPL